MLLVLGIPFLYNGLCMLLDETDQFFRVDIKFCNQVHGV